MKVSVRSWEGPREGVRVGSRACSFCDFETSAFKGQNKKKKREEEFHGKHSKKMELGLSRK